jgi:hypothetical protein
MNVELAVREGDATPVRYYGDVTLPLLDRPVPSIPPKHAEFPKLAYDSR